MVAEDLQVVAVEDAGGAQGGDWLVYPTSANRRCTVVRDTPTRLPMARKLSPSRRILAIVKGGGVKPRTENRAVRSSGADSCVDRSRSRK